LEAKANDAESYDCNLLLTSQHGALSDEAAQELADWVDARLEALLIERFGDDEGEDRHLELIMVNVFFNDDELV
jgi:hypothetical protein